MIALTIFGTRLAKKRQPATVRRPFGAPGAGKSVTKCADLYLDSLARLVMLRWPGEGMMMQSVRHSFAARCPRGHRPAQMRTLTELRDPNVRFYCRLCGSSWMPAHDDLTKAVRFAEASEHQTDTPPFAA